MNVEDAGEYLLQKKQNEVDNELELNKFIQSL